ncbi:MAG: PKD domain-containing protein [Gammaproteobacteria bacterium]|nr:PKD domain-containing protein [Gammaproteobacteria bacterium]
MRPLIAALLGAGALIAAPAVYASSNGLADWRDTYPNSNSDDAGCQLCHGSSTNQLNAYGRNICLAFAADGARPGDWGQTYLDIEPLDSDGDGSANGTEIANNTQPGWTSGGFNPLYIADFTQGCAQIAADSTVPNSVPLPYDISFTGDPIANPNGPYAALVGETITFDGSGSTDDGEIVRYDWSFGDGAVAMDAGPQPQHTYNAEGVYNVVLTVTDNDGNTNAAGTIATISPPELLDLDVNTLSVSRTARIGKAIDIKLKVENNGTVLGQAIATVVGMQNGMEVYRLRLNVFDDIGRGATTFDFGSYTPSTAGDIAWTATIADGDPDIDEQTAVTAVK